MQSVIKNTLYSISLMFFSMVTFATTELTAWPPEAAKQLSALIEKQAHQGHFAVFDMDNTSYRYDLSESLLPFLEMKGVLTRQSLDPALQLIPFLDLPQQAESLYSYYQRLCAIDALICYPWIAQAFAGLTLANLKLYVDELMKYPHPITVTYSEQGKPQQKTIHPPRLLAGMQQLYAKLQENGIEVYVVTAAHEELVRMVASDPQYGYHVKPENVLGVTTLLRDPKTGEVTTSRLQIKQGQYQPSRNQTLTLTSYLVNPMTWYEGKAATIIGWIDQWRKPILVAGDTPLSDGFMLLNSTNVAQGGIRLWVNKKERDLHNMRTLWQQAAHEQQRLGLPVEADKNWLIVTPDELQ